MMAQAVAGKLSHWGEHTVSAELPASENRGHNPPWPGHLFGFGAPSWNIFIKFCNQKLPQPT
jgi:hypothetical protein